MAITAITSVQNDLEDDIYVADQQNLTDADYTLVRPAITDAFKIWVPWADNEDQFINGSNAFQGPAHITIYRDKAGQIPLFSIWQSGDHLFYALGERYPADPSERKYVLGNNTIGGDRSLAVVDLGAGAEPQMA